MIRDWKEHELYMDFSDLNVGFGQPSDIDMFYIGKNGFMLIGEIKHRRGELKDGQRRLLERLIDNYKRPAMCIFIQHDRDVYEGAESVNVAYCEVVEYYYKHQWHTPREYLQVIDVINKISGKTY